MRLVVDFQGLQSTSRNRGIGRYSRSLAEAMLRECREHEVWLVLNARLEDSIEPLRSEFAGLLPHDRIHVWDTLAPVSASEPSNEWRQRAGKILHGSAIAGLKPDMIHISSLFEGLGDAAAVSVDEFTSGEATAVTLYDLIPLIFQDTYLADPEAMRWYQRKLTDLRRAGLLLAISECTRADAINLLDVPAESVVTISGAADDRFRPTGMHPDTVESLLRRHRLTRPFLMYTGGIDHRKNIEGLISAFALLPHDIRRAHQLAIVCSASEDAINSAAGYAKSQGLDDDELVLTGYVKDDDLVALYNLCTGFCFPSKYEGFGLPALEAMSCGAPTIGSNVSSIPEIIGLSCALFDPNSPADIARRLHQLLADPDFRRSLSERGMQRARSFTWASTAKRAWDALEDQYARTKAQVPSRPHPRPQKRLRLAFVSPLPPEESGIADINAVLLPALARHYDIDVIVHQGSVSDPWISANVPIRDTAWLDDHARSYDRILYHFGNSVFHSHMFECLARHPGVVVLHDFYLSGIIAHLDAQNVQQGLWPQLLYRSHGYAAVLENCRAESVTEMVWKYPANLSVLETAVGVIVHSDFSRHLARQFYGERFANDWAVVPLARASNHSVDRTSARRALGFDEDDFIVCSFGMLGLTKLNDRLLDAWLGSRLGTARNCHLVFVGEADAGDFVADIRRRIERSSAGDRIRITSFVSPELFHRFLSATDVAVQLRTLSRGESSGAVLDCMSHGVPVVVNAHGSAAELPPRAVIMLPDNFTDAELATTLERLKDDPRERQAIGARARAYIKEFRSLRIAAEKYHEAVEHLYAQSPTTLSMQALGRLAENDPDHLPDTDWLEVARAHSRNLPGRRAHRQLLVDVTALVQEHGRPDAQEVARNLLLELLTEPPPGLRVEPVYAPAKKAGYRYARGFTLQLLDCNANIGSDEPIDFYANDVFLRLDVDKQTGPEQAAACNEMSRFGVAMHAICCKAPLRQSVQRLKAALCAREHVSA